VLNKVSQPRAVILKKQHTPGAQKKLQCRIKGGGLQAAVRAAERNKGSPPRAVIGQKQHTPGAQKKLQCQTKGGGLQAAVRAAGRKEKNSASFA
jgi:hypothetical protein